MTPSKQNVSLRQMLAGESGFFYGAELVTTRGITAPGQGSKLVELGEALAVDPRIGWISVTDNPGGNPMLPADWLGRILQKKSCEIVIHLTCKDLNRNGLESAAWRYAAEGFDNILAITGDYPAGGYQGLARPVFDLDSVSLIAMLSAMNDGLQVPGRKGTETLTKTNFFIGCGVSPFKRHERELMPQYFKLARKIRSGAQWVIPQLGYDMRKAHELKRFLEWAKLPATPLVGNVYLLNKTVAGMFNENKIPGCVVSDELRELCEKQAAGPDKGARFFQELAAKQLAVFKGLGYAAGYLAGIAKAETFGKIIDLAESFSPDDWKQFAKEIQFPQRDEFYLFEKDEQTGLSSSQVNQQYLESLKNPPKTQFVTLGYRLSRKVHDLAFTPDKGLFNAGTRFFEKRKDQNGDGLLTKALHKIEHASKVIGYGCKDCGDCSLPDCAYLCPRASCSKGTRNGPCGGSRDGTCELDDKECLWARAYDRLKYYGESEHFLDGPAVFTDARLEGTSSWANLFLGRDHHRAVKSSTVLSPVPKQKE